MKNMRNGSNGRNHCHNNSTDWSDMPVWAMPLEYRQGKMCILTPDKYLKKGVEERLGFGHKDVNQSAMLLVQFHAWLRSWRPFTLTELASFCRSQRIEPGHVLLGLMCSWQSPTPIGGGWQDHSSEAHYIVQYGDGRFVVTLKFVGKLNEALEALNGKQALVV